MHKFIEDGITEKEIDEIRTAQEVFIVTEGILRRREFFPPDDYDHYKVIAENVPARVTAGFGTFRDVGDRYAGITPFTITFSWDQDVKADDHFIDAVGRVFHIRDTKVSAPYIHTATQCLADLITDG